MRKRNARAVVRWSVMLATAACADVQAPEGKPRIAPDVMASVVTSPLGGISGFRFDAPIVTGTTLKGPGVFDGSLADLLSVEVCEWSGAACNGTPIR
jgi:hypothetical protein